MLPFVLFRRIGIKALVRQSVCREFCWEDFMVLLDTIRRYDGTPAYIT